MLRSWLLSLFCLGLFALVSAPAAAGDGANLFFLHHSTGRLLIDQGGVRALIADLNVAHGTDNEFWDHDYNYIGLRDPEGVLLGRSYGIPSDNTDPDGLHHLWTTANPARATILANHQVIAFKSCYPACAIDSDAQLEQYKSWYREIRNFLRTQTGHSFVVMSPPPLHRLATTPEQADRARAFADWLKSWEYLGGAGNIVCFDLFDHLAAPDDGGPTRNMLRWEYERSHTGSDSHPNTLANQIVGPYFVEAMLLAVGVVPAAQSTLGGVKAMFR